SNSTPCSNKRSASEPQPQISQIAQNQRIPPSYLCNLWSKSSAMALLEVKIPPMGESINSGLLAKWHVNDGDTVKKDQPLFELETDKITSEGTAEAAGKISLKVAVGDEVKIGQVVATIDPAATTSGGAAPAPRTEAAPA